jgi:hypothetical protein
VKADFSHSGTISTDGYCMDAPAKSPGLHERGKGVALLE